LGVGEIFYFVWKIGSCGDGLFLYKLGVGELILDGKLGVVESAVLLGKSGVVR